MNSFENFTLAGANITRYVPIYGNAAGLIGAYRKVVESIGIGQVPLFLLDGELNVNLLNRAVSKLRLSAFVAIYRSYDLTLRQELEKHYKDCISHGIIKSKCLFGKTDSEDVGKVNECYLKYIQNADRAYIDELEKTPEWVAEYESKEELSEAEYAKYHTYYDARHIRSYLYYERALEKYEAAIAAPPINAASGEPITGDMNEYLYKLAKSMFPFGVESLLESNMKQSAIPKHQYFIDGIENAPAPKGVRQNEQKYGQLSLFEPEGANIDDTVMELRKFFLQSIEKNGAVRLAEIISYCSEIGLYKGNNITLYALGAACRSFIKDTAVFYDGVAYWRYAETQNISTWILRVYELLQPRWIRGEFRLLERKESDAAMFFDNTALKDRIRGLFGIGPPREKLYDTLGYTIVHTGKWIIDNLRYPIDFLDGMLHELFRENELFGSELQRFDAYFTDERCEWLKSKLPFADDMARQAIEKAVGFDPECTEHGMSWHKKGKGHYAPVLYSAEQYINEIIKEKPGWMK